MHRLIVAAALCFALPAAAQTPPASQPVTEHVFTPEEVPGRIKTPGGDVIRGERGERFRSLVKVRETFRNELIQSAEDI